MKTSDHIHKLCQRNLKQLDDSEIENGIKVCELFKKLWKQLANELNALNCFASTLYRGTHVKRYIYIFSDDNLEWLELWSDPRNGAEVMLRPSWYVFNALEHLNKAHKKH